MNMEYKYSSYKTKYNIDIYDSVFVTTNFNYQLLHEFQRINRSVIKQCGSCHSRANSSHAEVNFISTIPPSLLLNRFEKFCKDNPEYLL